MAHHQVLLNNNEESSESSDAQDDIWDDTLLIKAYDRAVGLATGKIETKPDTKPNKTNDEEAEQNNLESGNKSKKDTDSQWSNLDHCRAVYSEDGVEYEAVIVKIMNRRGTCIVHYIGYDNEEEVELISLKPSKGESARLKQLSEAANTMEIEETPCNIESPKYKEKCYPGMSVLPPPPPPHIMNNLPKNETEALSAMLMSWYMSGYHTGYYFGLANSSKNGHPSNSQTRSYGRHNRKK